MLRKVGNIWIRRWFGRYTPHSTFLRALFNVHSPSLSFLYNSDILKRVWRDRSFEPYWSDLNADVEIKMNYILKKEETTHE